MAVIRNAANTVMVGRVGQTTYYISGGQQIARQSKNDSNYGSTARRSYNQQVRRVKWANLVNMYKMSAIWMPKAFESRKLNQTDYNKFMQVNIDNSNVALSKSEAVAGACVVDSYVVSQGSLPSIECNLVSEQMTTNIALGELTISASTTVGQFSQAVINNNTFITEGMQLSFVSYQQYVDALGIPRVTSRLYEVTLDTNSTESLRVYLPELCSQVIDGYLGTTTNLPLGGYTYLLSGLVSGALKVSSQQLEVNNSQLINRYTSAPQLGIAISSYGLDQEVILSPATINAQGEEPAVFAILSISDGTNTYYPGGYVGLARKWYNNPMTVVIENLPNIPAPRYAKVDMVYADSSVENGSSITISGNEVRASFTQIPEQSGKVVAQVIVSYGPYTEPTKYQAVADFATTQE